MVVGAPTMRRSERSLQIWRRCSEHVAQAFCERAVIVLAVALIMGVRALKQEIYEACPTPFRTRQASLRHLRGGCCKHLPTVAGRGTLGKGSSSNG